MEHDIMDADRPIPYTLIEPDLDEPIPYSVVCGAEVDVVTGDVAEEGP